MFDDVKSRLLLHGKTCEMASKVWFFGNDIGVEGITKKQ